MPQQKPIQPLPFRYYFWPVVILALAGLLDSLYLAHSHYRVYMDMGYRSFCAISKAINCDTVSQSVYAILWGVPVPVWGVFGYGFILLLLAFAGRRDAQKKRIWPILYLVCLAYSIYSIGLAYISTFYIHSYCIMCIVSYAINFALLFYTWLIRRRFDSDSLIAGLRADFGYFQRRKTIILPVLAVVTFVFVALLSYFPRYWLFAPPALKADIPTGLTSDGHPWIGAENPELSITEFTDYQCFQCKKLHYFLRELIVRNPGKLRLVHRHFPMDHEFNPLVKEPFHNGSGAMAMLGVYAAAKNKFWEMNDALFETAGMKQDFGTQKLAEKTGIAPQELTRALSHPAVKNWLLKDIRDGLQLGITGTPGFVIKDEVYQGQIPPHLLKDFIQ